MDREEAAIADGEKGGGKSEVCCRRATSRPDQPLLLSRLESRDPTSGLHQTSVPLALWGQGDAVPDTESVAALIASWFDIVCVCRSPPSSVAPLVRAEDPSRRAVLAAPRSTLTASDSGGGPGMETTGTQSAVRGRRHSTHTQRRCDRSFEWHGGLRPSDHFRRAPLTNTVVFQPKPWMVTVAELHLGRKDANEARIAMPETDAALAR